ncbi:glycerophosphodiester phosphodiesterase [Arthrobacter halodurans]|uniref:Glycerophosphodiester phosphodiesterase n=1 Tax=Arthrobacter halodurans TaxID=516699 RepID=A0ABV4UVF4_9MICC
MRSHRAADVPFLRQPLTDPPAPAPGPGSVPAPWPLAFAHRGFAPRGEENTMAAFRAAVGLGFRYLELDVRASRDGRLMVFHDETLDRVTDGSGRLGDHAFGELRRLRVAGREPIPAFEELLAEWPDVRLNVDVKDARSAALLARAVALHGAQDRVLVASFADSRRRRLLRELGVPIATSGGAPTIALATFLGPLGLMPVLRPLLRGVAALQVPVRHGSVTVVTPGFVRRAHAAGLHVHVWVVDRPDEMHRLLDLGVDGLMSDRADVLAAVMAERGCWPQRPLDRGADRSGAP